MLNKICLEHGIKPLEPEKARGTLEIPEYKEKRRQADELAEQNAQVEAELSEKQAKSEKLDAQIEKKTATVNAIMNYLPDLEKDNKVEDDCLAIRQELDSLLDGKLSIMKHKDDIAMERSGHINELSRENAELRVQNDAQAEFISIFKSREPQRYAEVKQVYENIQAQREQEVQQSTTRKKKSWGLE